MMNLKNRTEKFVLGVWVVVFGASLSSCRFGNYSEPAKNTNTKVYKSVELFLTEPASLQTTVLYKDSTPSSNNTNTPLSAIPASAMNTFTDPVYFATPVDSTKSPMFADFTQTNVLTTALDSTGAIKYEYDSSIVPLWSNPKCLTQVQLFQDGSFDRLHGVGTVITFPDQSTAKTAGRLTLDFTFIRVIDGGATAECTQDLQHLAQCYTGGTTCTSDELKAANMLFDLYVTRGAVLKIEDVAKIKALAYVVHFQ